MSFQVSIFEQIEVMLISYSFPYVSFILLLIGFSSPPDGSELKGERLTVQFARGPRKRDDYAPQERQAPRPRRTVYRLQITGLAPDTSWQVRTLKFERGQELTEVGLERFCSLNRTTGCCLFRDRTERWQRVGMSRDFELRLTWLASSSLKQVQISKLLSKSWMVKNLKALLFIVWQMYV